VRNVPTTCYKILQINARSFTHNQCLSKGLKKFQRSQPVKFKFQMQIKTLSSRTVVVLREGLAKLHKV